LVALVLLLAPAGASAHFWSPPPPSETISAGGSHSCAIRPDDASLACWGDDSAGQLDEVPGGEFGSVSAGGTHTCAIRTDDASLACWGDDSAGQLDEVPGGAFRSVSAGGTHTCAIRADDSSLACWGDDSAGQLDEVPGGAFRSVSSGGTHTCAIRWDEDLVCWGDDSAGQLDGVPNQGGFHFYFHHHHFLFWYDEPDFVAVAAGGAHTCAIREHGGTLLCWGDDSAGQLDEVPDGAFRSVSAGGTHTCAIRTDASLACWGDDSAGQLDGVPDGAFRSVSAGGTHTCAAGEGGGVACWGDNTSGQVEPWMLTDPLPSGVTGTPYSFQFATTPQAPLPVFSLTSGKLPDGLKLDAKGKLSGTPTKAGTFAFTVGASNGITPDAEREVTLKVVDPPAKPVVAVQQVAPPEGLPPPTAGVNFNIDPLEGTVRIKCGADDPFVNLPAPKQVPISCTVDTKHGTAGLTTSKGAGAGTQSAHFWGGIFGVSQSAGQNWDTQLKLTGRLKCEKRKGGGAARTSRRRVRKRGKGAGRKLWGSGKGNYTTSGNYGSATVRGTTWLVVDRCDNSTLFGVQEGVVTVSDFAKGTTLSLYPGQHYVARGAIPRLR
jgi:Putative Ig domain/Regulator of chromosome condensation (RCC1) repeat